MDALLFVDTNILLDFYRDRKSDISMKFLEQIEACKDRLILGSQVEMEYKKNRQHVILESLGKFGAPDWGKLSAPALVSETQAAGMIDKHRKELVKQQKIVTEKIQNILEKPGTQDEVYKVLQRVFKHNSRYNLDREDKRRFAIRRLARKRFFLGYPPEKRTTHPMATQSTGSGSFNVRLTAVRMWSLSPVIVIMGWSTKTSHTLMTGYIKNSNSVLVKEESSN